MGIVVLQGGLCNYLRVVFSYFLLAKEKDEKLVVVWKKTHECQGYFLDHFYPIEGIIFLKSKNNKIIEQYNHSFNISTCGVHKDYAPCYKLLKPLPNISNIIKEKLEILENNYIAVHIRRTDHISLAKKNKRYTSDEDFFDFIKNNQGEKNLYIATDNKQTYDLFVKKIKGGGIKFPYHKNINKNAHRHTSLTDAIIDLYVCAYADDFMGSGWSSFSSAIKAIKKQDALIKY